MRLCRQASGFMIVLLLALTLPGAASSQTSTIDQRIDDLSPTVASPASPSSARPFVDRHLRHEDVVRLLDDQFLREIKRGLLTGCES